MTAQRLRIRTVAISGLLVAVMLVLGRVEALIPINAGVPGIKLGLSNSVLIFAVYMLDVPTAYCLMLLKVLLSGLMFGGISAMLYAFAGGVLSLTAMCLLSRFDRLPAEAVGCAGGALHNVGQVALAMVVMRTTGLLGYMAILVPVGMLCGFLTGTCARLVIRHLRAARLLPEAPEAGRHSLLPILVALVLLAITMAVIVRGNPTLFRPAVESTTEWGVPIR